MGEEYKMIGFAVEDSEIEYLASGLLVVSAWSTVSSPSRASYEKSCRVR